MFFWIPHPKISKKWHQHCSFMTSSFEVRIRVSMVSCMTLHRGRKRHALVAHAKKYFYWISQPQISGNWHRHYSFMTFTFEVRIYVNMASWRHAMAKKRHALVGHARKVFFWIPEPKINGNWRRHCFFMTSTFSLIIPGSMASCMTSHHGQKASCVSDSC